MPQSVNNKPFRPEETVEGAMQFEAIVGRLIGRNYTATLVKVDAVGSWEEPENADIPNPVGWVNATDMIQQVNADNVGIPNAPMFKLPFFRLQGGSNAVVIDPKKGDIGIAIFAMRDISELKRNKEESAPPSRRQYDVSDGLYIGGLLNGTPSQYIQFLESGINIVATGKVTTTTPNIFEVNAKSIKMVTSDGVDIIGAITADSTIAAKGDISTESSVSADSDVSDGTGSMADMRTAYNSHAHTSSSPGNPTSPPDTPMG